MILYKILLMSNEYYRDYPSYMYNELEGNRDRPFNCLSIPVRNYYICIPFRSHINHNNAYLFSTSVRSWRTRSGLDYTKLVIVQKTNYISCNTGYVDHDEYVETDRNIEEIAHAADKYINDYISHIKGERVLRPATYNRRYRFSTLPYFHDELGI